MVSNLVIPGDSLPIDSDSTTNVTIGPGIYKNPKTQEIIPASAGILNTKTNKQNTNRIIFTESNSKRYIPQTNDFVIGIIVGVFGESYKVQLQDFSTSVQLSMMAFPNATKKNRPNLKTGQAVYARVSQAILETDTELECIDPINGKEGGFGLLDESGYIFNVNLNFARELLFNQDSVFLERLATKCKFEIAIGINGKVWIKCGEGIRLKVDNEDNESGENTSSGRDLRATLAASRFITKCQNTKISQVDNLLKESFKNI